MPLSRLLAFASAALLADGASAASDAVCPADGSGDCSRVASDDGRPYPWPQAKGPHGTYGVSPHAFGGLPCNLSANLAWSWHHPEGRTRTVLVGGPLIDDEHNVYVASMDAVWKLSPAGKLLWHREGATTQMPSLWNGALYLSCLDGTVSALSMETGSQLWTKRLSSMVGNDTGSVTVHKGILVGSAMSDDWAGGDTSPGHNAKIYALNASTGDYLWDFVADAGVFNFVPSFDDEGALAFQNREGGVYRVNLTDGRLIWRGGKPKSATGSFTDGGSILGPNRVLYAVSSQGTMLTAAWGHPGALSAYSLDDGSLLWEQGLEQAPYTWPAVLRLGGSHDGRLAVVVGVGSVAMFPLQEYLRFAVYTAGPFGVCLGVVWGVYGCAFGMCGRRCSVASCRLVGRRLVLCWLGTVLLFWVALVGFVPKRFSTFIAAFDAATGEPIWRWNAPTWHWWSAAGDEEAWLDRVRYERVMRRSVCLPPAMSLPTVDAKGILYIGHMDGHLYGLRDTDGDGKIDDKTEVCRYDTGTAFHVAGPAIVPGMAAIKTCDSLYVFKAA